MATLSISHAPILQSSAQMLILPVSSEGTVLDPVVRRCRTLFPNNYKTYRRHCIDGLLPVGSSLLHKRQREVSGLGASDNKSQPSYLVNLATFDHPYHPLRRLWLNRALDDIHPKLFDLIRYEGLRRAALLARPLLYNKGEPYTSDPTEATSAANLRVPILDWNNDIYPIIQQKLKDLPRITIDIHLPKSIQHTPDLATS